MSDQKAQGVTRGVTYEGRMRLYWTNRGEVPEAVYQEQSDHNDHLLRSLLLAHETHRDALEEGKEQTADLLRIEAKLDLLLDLVSQLIKKGANHGEECEVQLWLSGVSWNTRQPDLPKVGQSLWLHLEIEPKIPRPLKLPVQVIDTKTSDHDARITVKFDGLEESIEDLISRLIFRQHRRKIAQRRAEGK